MATPLITDDPDKVFTALYKALNRLIINRLEDGAFTDEEEVKDRHYFSTLEGLECLLIPFTSLDKNQFWEPLKNTYPELHNIIIDDVNFILNYNLGKDDPPKEHGYPYFLEGSKRNRPYWTSECSSYTISVLSNFLELRKLYGLPQNPKKKDIEEVIKQNFEWAGSCKKENKGWAWVGSRGSIEHPWPTWSLLDTFEELLWYSSTKNLYKEYEKDCDRVVEYILSCFDSHPPGLYFTMWQEKVLNHKPSYVIEATLDLIRLMLASTLYSKDREVLPLAQMLYTWVNMSKITDCDYKHYLRDKSENIYDSSLVPSLLRTLIIMAQKLYPRMINSLDDCLSHNHKNEINKIYRKLTENKISHGKHEDLWGTRSEDSGTTYELYFTERTLEALTAFLLNYPAKKIEEVNKFPKIKSPAVAKEKKKSIAGRSARSEIPNDISKYTLWIPTLTESIRPDALTDFNDWPIEDLAEFYLYRLFNVALALDGAEWGYREKGKPIPDARLTLPDSKKQCLYDVKTSKGPYKLDIGELRKFKDYAVEGKKKAAAGQKEVQFFLVIANSFEGDLRNRASEFHSEANLRLVCMNAKDICSFADAVRIESTNPSELQLIKWSLLLSKGDPLVGSDEYDKIRTMWLNDLEKAL